MPAYFTIQKCKHVNMYNIFMSYFVLRKAVPKAVGMKNCLFFISKISKYMIICKCFRDLREMEC